MCTRSTAKLLFVTFIGSSDEVSKDTAPAAMPSKALTLPLPEKLIIFFNGDGVACARRQSEALSELNNRERQLTEGSLRPKVWCQACGAVIRCPPACASGLGQFPCPHCGAKLNVYRLT